jgi:hypothetical protein
MVVEHRGEAGMIDQDEAALVFAAAILRGSGREIEALSLEAIAADTGPGGLDQALTESSQSETRGGAFGMEIAGALILPLVIDAVRQVWKAYSGELIKKIGTSAADATISQLTSWFRRSPAEDLQQIADRLAEAIRTAGVERGLATADIDALVAATAPEKLSDALAPK